jgi:hypothetical protein
MTYMYMYQVHVCMHTSENAECISISKKINVVNAKIGQYLLYVIYLVLLAEHHKF